MELGRVDSKLWGSLSLDGSMGSNQKKVLRHFRSELVCHDQIGRYIECACVCLAFVWGWGWCVECDVKDSAFGESPRLKDVSTPSLMRNIKHLSKGNDDM